jgi:hypothetical protein
VEQRERQLTESTHAPASLFHTEPLEQRWSQQPSPASPARQPDYMHPARQPDYVHPARQSDYVHPASTFTMLNSTSQTQTQNNQSHMTQTQNNQSHMTQTQNNQSHMSSNLQMNTMPTNRAPPAPGQISQTQSQNHVSSNLQISGTEQTGLSQMSTSVMMSGSPDTLGRDGNKKPPVKDMVIVGMQKIAAMRSVGFGRAVNANGEGIYVDVCMYVCMYVCRLLLYMYVCIYVCIYVCMYVDYCYALGGLWACCQC